jgi:hypothetical protein
MLSYSTALNSETFLGPFFSGDSWALAKALLAAMNGEPLSDDQKTLFASVAGGRAPPASPVSTMAIIAGRGSGKDCMAAAMATVEAVNFDRRNIPSMQPGERAMIATFGPTLRQASITFQYISGYFNSVPALKAMIVREMATSLELSTGVTIECFAPSFKSSRGFRIIVAILTETAFFPSDDAALTDFALDTALAPSLGRTKGSKKILISSPHRRAGLLYQVWSDYFGKDDPNTCVVVGPTLTFNPTFDAELIARQVAMDPHRFGSEYLATWNEAESSYIPRALIDEATEPNIRSREPQVGIDYVAATDSAGGRGKSAFTLAIAHDEDGVAVLDHIEIRRPPFDAYEVAGEYAGILRQYGCAFVTGDNFAGDVVASAFARHGIRYVKAAQNRTAFYTDLLPLMTSRKCRLLDDETLAAQMGAL